MVAYAPKTGALLLKDSSIDPNWILILDHMDVKWKRLDFSKFGNVKDNHS